MLIVFLLYFFIYSGAFGAHVAGVLRRLWRITLFHHQRAFLYSFRENHSEITAARSSSSGSLYEIDETSSRGIENKEITTGWCRDLSDKFTPREGNIEENEICSRIISDDVPSFVQNEVSDIGIDKSLLPRPPPLPLQFICCSATIANPAEHVLKLLPILSPGIPFFHKSEKVMTEDDDYEEEEEEEDAEEMTEKGKGGVRIANNTSSDRMYNKKDPLNTAQIVGPIAVVDESYDGAPQVER